MPRALPVALGLVCIPLRDRRRVRVVERVVIGCVVYPSPADNPTYPFAAHAAYVDLVRAHASTSRASSIVSNVGSSSSSSMYAYRSRIVLVLV